MPEVVNTSALIFEEASGIDSKFVEPEDERPTAISVENVSMIFNMASEQLNNLKEYFLKLVKHELFFEAFSALNDVSFEVKKGDVFGILGTNGSGKSTLLKIIAGVLEPTQGTVSLSGSIAPLIELGAGFDMDLSARENIYLNGALLGYSKDFIDQHFDEIVDFAEVEKFLDMPMKNYSSGMVARIAFAIATVIVPEILIVDEVLSVGDFIFQQKCEDRIAELIEKHKVTVLIVSHSNDQIERLCNKAIWIEKGHTRAIGDALQVCGAYRALGGRVGSAESEACVFAALKKAAKLPASELNYITTGGANASEISANIAIENWIPSNCSAVVMVPDFSYSYAATVSGIAGALQAPILSYGIDSIDPATINAILALSPETIYLLGSQEEFSSAESRLKRRGINASLKWIPRTEDLETNDSGIIDFGLNDHLLNSDAMYICYFVDRYPAMSKAPDAYSKQLPLMMVSNDRDSLDDIQLEVINRHKPKKIIALGSICKSNIASELEGLGYKVELIENPELDFLQFNTEDSEEKLDLCVASRQEAHWSTLLGTPALCGKLRMPILFENTLSLDDEAACIELIQHMKPKQIYFIGSPDITESDKKVLASASKEI